MNKRLLEVACYAVGTFGLFIALLFYGLAASEQTKMPLIEIASCILFSAASFAVGYRLHSK